MAGIMVYYREWKLALALILLALVSLLTQKTELFAVSAPVEHKQVVVLDAGHGGADSGKVAVNNVLEKDINLQIVFYLKEALESRGLTVVLTRQDENGLYLESDGNKKLADMKKRCEIIEKSRCVLTVSIHQNSYHEESVSGPQVFYYATSVEGQKIAACIQESMIQALNPEKIRAAKPNDTYYLLKKAVCPIVIVECGFLSNWKEAELLCQQEYQQKVAESVAAGIQSYLEQK